jgi:N-acetylneuraminate synthase
MNNITVSINGRKIGVDHPPYVICELSGNHNGSLEKALLMIDAAAKTGCDAIKIQSYTPDTMTIDCDLPDFTIKQGTWKNYNLYKLYEEAHTPFEWHKKLFQRASEHNITIFSTPFDKTAADMLDEYGTPAFKIASFEVIDLELISHVASKRKPMIISTGMATLSEIENAVQIARESGCNDLILLHCISSYPAPSDQSNLRTIPHLMDAFNVVGGLSDHTHGTATSVAAIALGGSVIEKHFTLARSDGGPDSSFSLEPDEFTRLCRDCKDCWVSLGAIDYKRKPAEEENVVFRRSIYAVESIDEGELITRKNVKVIRPGFGLSPSEIKNIIGRKAKIKINRGMSMSYGLLD